MAEAAQPKVGTKTKVGIGVSMGAIGTAAALAYAVPAVSKFEGVWLTAKVDRIGTGQPVTWCYGETEGPVRIGQTFTLDQCKEMLRNKLPRYNREISPCIRVPISDLTRAALISAAYNAGSGAVCKSSVLQLLNAGDGPGACEAIKTWYIRARGVVVKGLQNRRREESAMCAAGLSQPKIGADGQPIVPVVTKSWWQK